MFQSITLFVIDDSCKNRNLIIVPMKGLCGILCYKCIVFSFFQANIQMFYNSILHYKWAKQSDCMSVKFAARVKRGLQSHEMLSLCFVSSNVYYFS